MVDCLPNKRIHEYAEADLDKNGRIINFQVIDISISYLDGSFLDKACKIIGTTPSKTIMEIYNGNKRLEQGSLYGLKNGLKIEI